MNKIIDDSPNHVKARRLLFLYGVDYKTIEQGKFSGNVDKIKTKGLKLMSICEEALVG